MKCALSHSLSRELAVSEKTEGVMEVSIIKEQS